MLRTATTPSSATAARAIGRRWLSSHPIVDTLKSHPKEKVAIRHVASGNSYTYGQLTEDIDKWRSILLNASNNPSAGQRIAIMGENSYQFVVPWLAIMTLPNTLAIPLSTNHTAAEIQYQLENSRASMIVSQDRFNDKVKQFESETIKLLSVDQQQQNKDQVQKDDDYSTTSGYMLYTSGTSGKPKGVVTPLDTFVAQAKALSQAWNINSSTNFLQTLPLHHVHGLLIGTTLPLLAGGRVEYLFPFSPKAWADRMIDNSLPSINTYTAVPTIYSRLISYFKDEMGPESQKALTNAISQKLKLVMCGSAALPQPLRQGWDDLCNGSIPLLERYGMTETGITLSQPLNVEERVPGSVGQPVPSVECRLVDPEDGTVHYQSGQPGIPTDKLPPPGEIQMSGPVVFKEYWERPDATEETFTQEEGQNGKKWFKTGDIAKIDSSGNIFIQGRASMDIIKSGGEKISALEIEREILGLPEIEECSVIGIPNETWGEEVTAVAKLAKGVDTYEIHDLKKALKGVLAGWKIPKRIIVVDSIPKNQMGKVNKKDLVNKYK